MVRPLRAPPLHPACSSRVLPGAEEIVEIGPCRRREGDSHYPPFAVPTLGGAMRSADSSLIVNGEDHDLTRDRHGRQRKVFNAPPPYPPPTPPARSPPPPRPPFYPLPRRQHFTP